MIHNNLTAALEATNIVGTGREGGSRTLNAQAKAAARSAFESTKQRFYNHLLTAVKTPTLIKSIERDLEARPRGRPRPLHASRPHAPGRSRGRPGGPAHQPRAELCRPRQPPPFDRPPAEVGNDGAG